MFYTVYKITNKINGKIYIGCHKTTNIDDGYMGSGKLIKRAITKYGEENFSKELLGCFESEDQMFNEETNLISTLDPQYNLHPGGNGGWSYTNDLPQMNEHRRNNYIKSEASMTCSEKNRRNGLKQKARKSGIFSPKWASVKPPSFEGKKHRQESKEKIGEANKLHQKGTGNSQFGTMWITDGVTNKKIKKVDFVPKGWYKGRTIKQKRKYQ